MATINATAAESDSQSAPRPPGLRNRRRWLIPAAAALVLTAAAATQTLTGRTSDTTEVQCPGYAVIDAVTGDPIVDCSEQWRSVEGTEPPAMVAYDNGIGGIVVLLAIDEVPPGYVELEPGPHQNDALIQLKASLDDAGSGLESSCHDESTGQEIVRRELDRLGLATWTVVTDETRRPDGEALCAYFVLEPEVEQVQLIGLEGGTVRENPLKPYADALASQLNDSCMSLDEAAESARSLAAETVITVDGNEFDLIEQPGDVDFYEVEDPTADCTHSVVNVAGSITVTLRGPTS